MSGAAPLTTSSQAESYIGRQGGQAAAPAAGRRAVGWKGGGTPEENGHRVPTKEQVPHLFN